MKFTVGKQQTMKLEIGAKILKIHQKLGFYLEDTVMVLKYFRHGESKILDF